MLADDGTLTLETPEAYEPFLAPARWKGCSGGRASAKSHEFGEMLIEQCLLRPGLRALCVREHQISLRHSVKQLLEDKIKAMRVGTMFRPLNTHIETPGGGLINFVGMKNHTASSVKSLEGYDIAWVEEAQSLSKKSFTLLYPTIRKPGSELWFTWNRDQPTDPVDDFFEKNKHRPDVIHRHTTFRDNPFLPDVLKPEIEFDRRRDIDIYSHVWEGGYNTKSNARVFKNWRIGDPTEFPDRDTIKREKITLRYGGDFGFASDPTVLVELFIIGRTLYISAEAYMVGCEIDHTPFLFGGLNDWELVKKNREAYESIKPEDRSYYVGIEGSRHWRIVADSARPETISYLSKHGFPLIVPAKKGPNSVEEGVKFVQGFNIVVHPDCRHVIQELTLYSYEVDKITGEILPILADDHNHVIDAIRYALESMRRATGGFL